MSRRLGIFFFQFIAFGLILNFTWIFWWVTGTTPVKYPDDFLAQRCLSSILSFTQVYVGFQIILKMIEAKRRKWVYFLFLIFATLCILLFRAYCLNDLILWRDCNSTRFLYFLKSFYYHLVSFNVMGIIVFLPEFLFRYQKKKEKLNRAINENFLKSSRSSFYSDFYIEVIRHLSKKEDKTRSEEIVLKLSDLLRFIVYESESNFIPINKEIKFTNLFIDLQSIVQQGVRIQGQLSIAHETHKILGMDIMNVLRHAISFAEAKNGHVELIINGHMEIGHYALIFSMSTYAKELFNHLQANLSDKCHVKFDGLTSNRVIVSYNLEE